MNADNDPQNLWKLDDPGLPESFAPGDICTLARRRERENVWSRRIGLLALTGLAAAFVHNTWTLDQPSVRLGQGWMGIVMTVYLWSLIRNRSDRRASHEPCAKFLLRSLEVKRDGYLTVRLVVLLTIPGLVASWWANGGALRARAMGLDPSSSYSRYLTSGWPIVATCVLLVVVWFAFSGAAKKATAEFETLRRRITAA